MDKHVGPVVESHVVAGSPFAGHVCGHETILLLWSGVNVCAGHHCVQPSLWLNQDMWALNEQSFFSLRSAGRHASPQGDEDLVAVR